MSEIVHTSQNISNICAGYNSFQHSFQRVEYGARTIRPRTIRPRTIRRRTIRRLDNSSPDNSSPDNSSPIKNSNWYIFLTFSYNLLIITNNIIYKFHNNSVIIFLFLLKRVVSSIWLHLG